MDTEYPGTLLAFEARFATEGACRDYLMHLRWPEGFVCPRCGGVKLWRATRGRLMCGDCRYTTTVTAGTIFQDTHQPLRVWFRAIWQVTSQKTGANALGLQRVLGQGSYVTAWTMLHKLRRAMVRPGRDRLRGRVEVDEIYIGGQEVGREGRTAQTKALVAVAAEEDGEGIGRIRLARIPNVKKDSCHRFVAWAVERGSVVHTDGWTGYLGLDTQGYFHEVTPLDGRPKTTATEAMPRVHRVSALLKRWLLGTHQGAVRANQLDYYLDEFTFRFNRRTSRSRGKLFCRLLQQAVQVDPAPYKRIVGGNPTPKI